MSVAGCLEALDTAVDAASVLGLDVSAAAEVRDLARERLAFPSPTYLLALAGGTGVGKSSLLNALAGREVSPAGIRRPTTDSPVAYVPLTQRGELSALLEWLGVTDVRTADGDWRLPGEVAILDLPDLDSVAAAHRAKVDELLPRVDAVAWVVDPEKYADALLHDSYLPKWGTRLGRQAVVLNKVDRLVAPGAERVRQDIGQRLERHGMKDVPVVLASAHPDQADGLGELRYWLSTGAEAKQVVLRRVTSGARAAVGDLSAAAGIAGGYRALLEPAERDAALDQVVREVLGILDIAGLRRQSEAATRQAARSGGGGPLGLITALVYRLLGRDRAVADPAGYAARWRERGSLARAAEPARAAVAAALPRVPSASRPTLLTAGEPRVLEERLGEEVDEALRAEATTFEPPRSRLWVPLGALQSLATIVTAFAVLWLVVLWLTKAGPVDQVEVPLLGRLPVPFVVLIGGLATMLLLGRVLAWHAGWLGRRWARRVADAVAGRVRRRVSEVMLAPLDRLESARSRLAEASAAAERECGDLGEAASPRAEAPAAS